MKRVISLFLSAVMLVTSIICIDFSAFAAELTISNRAQWLSKLVEIFDMSVASDNYPDNYFSDLTEDSEYYYDVLLAVEFGVIDVEAGDPVNPEGEITREFAAQTFNACLKYELENAEDENFQYTFTDYQQCAYPVDDQIAVNRGWFTLDENNQFCPEQVITSTEIDTMLADAQETLKGDEVDENYDSTYAYEKGVLEIPSHTAVEFADDNNIIIYDTSFSIETGDTFVVYSNGVPLVYDAEEVTVNSNNITVKAADTTNENAVEAVDMQTVFDIDANDFVPADGYEIVEETAPASAPKRAKAKSDKNSVNLSRTIDLPAGNSINIEIRISDIKVSNKMKTTDKSLTVKAEFDLSVHISGQFNLTDVGKDDLEDLNNLGSIPIAGIGYLDFKPELNFSGKTEYEQKYNVTIGFTKNDSGLRNISSFNKEKFSFVFEASCKFGLKVEVGLQILVAKVGVYAEIGAIAKAAAETSENADKVSTYCLTLSAYMYVKLGAEYNINIGFWKSNGKIEWQIYKETNSPVRLYFHFENGKSVDACTVGSKTKTKYTTPSTSKYGSVYEDTISDASNIVSAGDFKISTNSDGTAAITDYVGSAANLSIPEYIRGYRVTGIGNHAFEDCTSLTSITIPDSVTSIGYGAFYDCTSLTSITIPDSVTSIGGAAFRYCTSLTSITIPDSETSIGGEAFYGCKSLTGITIPDSVTSIGYYAFVDCTSLTSITIPNSVTSIGYSAFYDCTSLTSITIPDSVTSIDGAAFRYCTSLTSITIPDSVTSISAEAFYGCKSLTSVTIPNSVASIGDFAFEYCNSLTSITIPDSVTSIGVRAFWDCTSLTSITIPDSVTSIGDEAFYECTSLTGITIPDSVTSIGDRAFEGCTSLTNINVNNGNTNYASQDGVLFDKSKTNLIQYPIGNQRTHYSIPDSVTGIGYGAFSGCTSLTGVTIPDSVTSIGDYAFYECTSLTSVTIGNSVTGIGYGAFYYCTSLTSVTIGNSVTGIGYGAFYYCTSLTSITIPDSVTSISAEAFYCCKSLTSITIPDSVTNISYGTFAGCTSLTGITIPDSVTSIGDEAFDWCTSLTSITIPDSVTGIGDGAFSDCTSLTSITIPNSVTGIGDGAFSDCTSLTSITIPNSVTGIGYYVFEGCTSLTSITIPDSVTSIGDDAFYDCTSLTDVYYSGTITDWKHISIGAGNYYLTKATIHCMDGILNEKEPEHIHFYSTTMVNPTCTEKGYTIYTCECGDSYADDYVPATGHSWDNGKVTKPATCTAEGIRTYTCVDCGETKTEPIAKTAHTPVTDPAVTAVSCAKPGLTEGSHCGVCGEVLAAQTVVHSYDHAAKSTTTKATASKDGMITATCSVCGETLSTTVIPKASNIKLSKTGYTYNGKVQKPGVTVKDSKGKTLKNGTDYTVSYAKGRKNVGKYAVKVTFKGKYSGSKTLYFTITPKGTALSKVTAGKKKFTVKWKKQTSQTTGYQIQYSTDKNFKKNNKTVTVTKNKTTSKTISKLKAKKKYYVRIRTYKTVKVNGKNTKIYSSWSKAKTVTTKK